MSCKDWNEYRLGDIATFSYGKLPQKTRKGKGEYPIYTGYQYAGTYPEFNCRKGQLIVVARGVGGTGDVKQAPDDCFLTNLSIKLKANPNFIHTPFFYYKYRLTNLRFLDSGSAQSQITINDLSNLLIRLPPIPTQRRIAAILSAFDDKIELNRQMNRTLEEMAQALFREYFLTNGNEELCSVEEYIDFNPRISIPKGKEAPFVDMKALPTFGMSVDYVLAKGFTSGSKFQKDDTLLARITPCLENGKTAFVNFLQQGESGFGSTEFIVMRGKPGDSPQFVYCLSRNENFRQHAIGSMVGSSGRQRVQLDMLKGFEIPVVDPNLMSEFDEITKPLFDQINNNRIEIENLSALRDILLPELMSGEVAV